MDCHYYNIIIGLYTQIHKNFRIMMILINYDFNKNFNIFNDISNYNNVGFHIFNIIFL